MTTSEDDKKPEYNRLYEQLVLQAEDETDQMVGMLAYGEYKLKKNLFFSRYHDKHDCNPDNDAIDNFMLEYADEATRNELLHRAAQKLFIFADEYAERQKDVMLAEAKETAVVRTVRKSTIWWKNCLYSMLAAFTYSIILAGITFSITVLNPDSTVAKFITSLMK